MKDYSQNGEQAIILNYFKEKNGCFLSIGENDGQTLSNVRALALSGWTGTCVEPATEAFSKLQELYVDTPIECFNVAIGTENGRIAFYDMGTHLGKEDTSLLSTINKKEIDRWKGTVEFRETECTSWTFETLEQNSLYLTYDFISIDAEGMDYEILKQIPLTDVKMVCVEYNGKDEEKYVRYCEKYGLKVLHKNFENLIFAR